MRNRLPHNYFLSKQIFFGDRISSNMQPGRILYCIPTRELLQFPNILSLLPVYCSCCQGDCCFTLHSKQYAGTEYLLFKSPTGQYHSILDTQLGQGLSFVIKILHFRQNFIGKMQHFLKKLLTEVFKLVRCYCWCQHIDFQR